MCRARLALIVQLFAAFGGCIVAYRLSFNGKSNALEEVSVGIDKGATILYGNVTPVLSDQNVTENPFRLGGKTIANAHPSPETRSARPNLAAEAYKSRQHSTKELEALLNGSPKSLPASATPLTERPISEIGIRTDGAPPPSMEEYNELFLLDDVELPPGWWKACKYLSSGTRRHVYESTHRGLPDRVVKMPITQQASDLMLEEKQEAASEGVVAGLDFLQKLSRESGVLVLRKTIPSFYKALRRENTHHPASQPCIFEVSEKVTGWTLWKLWEEEPLRPSLRPLFNDIVKLIVCTIDLALPVVGRDRFDFIDWRTFNLIVEYPIPRDLTRNPLKVTLVDGDIQQLKEGQRVSAPLEEVAKWWFLDGIPQEVSKKDLASLAESIATKAKTLRMNTIPTTEQAVPQENLQPKPRPGRRTRDQRSSS